MERHLEPAPGSDEVLSAFDEEAPLVRPAWWRWVAVVVAIALIVATPFAYALYRIFH